MQTERDTLNITNYHFIVLWHPIYLMTKWYQHDIKLPAVDHLVGIYISGWLICHRMLTCVQTITIIITILCQFWREIYYEFWIVFFSKQLFYVSIIVTLSQIMVSHLHEESVVLCTFAGRSTFILKLVVNSSYIICSTKHLSPKLFNPCMLHQSHIN